MRKKLKILAYTPCYNEEKTIENCILSFPKNLVDTLLIIDDGSTDNSLKEIKAAMNKRKDLDIELIVHKKNMKVGYSTKEAIFYGLKNNYDIICLFASNGKDNPKELSLILNPIKKDQADYVQGSRFLKGGSYKNLPIMRRVMIKTFTFLFYLIMTNGRYFGTDGTNGFRAYRLSIFKNKNIDIKQKWLNNYELEIYIHYKIFQYKYRFTEVPVSKDYPFTKKYSKIRPFLDWYSIFRPILLLKSRVKK